MGQNRMNRRWLRTLFALLALTGMAALAGCGGGSGAPNNPFAPWPTPIGPLFVLPPAATVYSGIPAVLTVSGGAPPYQAFSSNSAILPVAQAVNGDVIVLLAANVAADTAVVITVQDAVGQTATSTVTVRPAPLFNTLTVVPSRTACGTNAVCSGDTATATVTVTGPTGVGIPNRQVRFDVITGAFAIQTNNPALPLASSVTVVSDANGNARVILQAAVNAPTQPAQIRATDLTTGNSVTALFTIVQQTDGSAILSVVPSTVTILGVDSAHCSSGFRIDYFIYGGTPPYHVSPSLPDAVFLVNSNVFASGNSFEAITNGTCVDPETFSIVDAIGRQTTATLSNKPGTVTPTPPPPPPALVITPTSASATACAGKTFTFVITGGTPSYGVSAATNPGPNAMVNPPVVQSSGGSVQISGFPAGASTTSVVVVDQSVPQKNVSATITCT